jgi:hypothetical protein
MAENKTKPTDQSVDEFLSRVPEERKRVDSFAILQLMKKVTRIEPRMWGDSIIGFGSYHYKYASGREGDMPLVGFSPRKQNLVLYIMKGFEEYDQLLGELGKHKTGVACLYINKLSDINLPVLEQLVTASYNYMVNKKQE